MSAPHHPPGGTARERRFATLRRAIRPGTRGIEIGPWRDPVAPKAAGHDTLVVDFEDTATLRTLARERGFDEASIAAIEEVDLVGDASRLLDLVRGAGIEGTFDWIVSCHNFEHLPDPLRFLRDCEALLAPQGALAMIVPDKRFCFDRFQPAATFAAVVEAHERRGDPVAESIWAGFRQQSLFGVRIEDDGAPNLLWHESVDDPARMRLRDPKPALDGLRRRVQRGAVKPFTGHRFRYTPAVLRAILFDLRVAGLTTLREEEITATPAAEFVVVLRADGAEALDAEEIVSRRTAYARAVEDEAAVVSGAYRALAAELAAARAELAALGWPARRGSAAG